MNSCALLARLNHQLSAAFVDLQDKSALLDVVCPIQTAILGLIKWYYNHFNKLNCFECLSPIEIAV